MKADDKKNKRAVRVTDERVIEVLQATAGIVAHAAKKLGYNRCHLWKKIANSQTLKEAYDSIQEANVDFAESKLLQAINAGDMTGIIFYLKCKGKKRGFVEKAELDVTQRDRQPLIINVNPTQKQDGA